ncbi:unnamed protein product [Urochloa humidicola]
MASLAVLISIVFATLASGAAGVRVELTRIHSGPGVTASQFVRDALRRDMLRHNARRLAASDNGTVSAPTRRNSPDGTEEYLMTLAIGTPPVNYSAIVDTGSDLIWTQCAPCSDQCFKQPSPLYNPASSTTFSILPCGSSLSMCSAAPAPGCSCPYNQTYGKGWTSGVQATETFTFGSTPADQTRVPNITFGCSNASSSGDWNGSSGLVGLGRAGAPCRSSPSSAPAGSPTASRRSRTPTARARSSSGRRRRSTASAPRRSSPARRRRWTRTTTST